jgi:hypothetical protein
MSDFAQIRFLPNRPLLRELSADRLNTILQEIKRNKPKGERGITVRQDGTGTYIGLAASLPRGGTSSAPATRQPWDLIARVDPDADPEDENPPYLVSVQPGTLNGFLPTNWNTEGGGKDAVCQSDGTLYYAKAIVATDGQAMTSVTIEIDENAPDPQEPQEFGIDNPIEIVFGLFAEGAVYRLIGAGNIAASPKLWLTTERQTPPAPGELPFSQYFFFR